MSGLLGVRFQLQSLEQDRPRRRAFAFRLALVLAAALPPAAAHAQSYTWGGAGSTTTTTDYNTGTNWSNQAAVPPPVAAGQTAVFGSVGSSTVVVTGGTISPDSWTFNPTAQSFSISGAAVSFGAAVGIINNANAGQTITISNSIVGGAAVQQSGLSTLILSGANTYAGGTAISAGTLIAAHATGSSVDALGTGTVQMTGGTLQFAVAGTPTFGNAVSVSVNLSTAIISAGAGSIELTNDVSIGAGATLQFGKAGDTGTVLLSGAGGTANATASVVVANGTLKDNGNTAVALLTFSAASTTVNAGATLDFNDSSNQAIRNLNGAGNVKTGSSGGNPLRLFVDGGTTSTFAGVISGSHPVEILSTIGSPGIGTMIFTGVNTYTGGTTVCNCATLQLGDATHSASIIGDVTVLGSLEVVNANTSAITSITNDGGVTTFHNATSASTMTITNVNGGETDFVDNSSAGNSTIVNRNNSVTTFDNFATAGNATITNRFGGETDFYGNSTAGSATIVNRFNGLTTFDDQSTAGNATITNRFGGETDFYGSSTAGSATIVNRFNGLTTFDDQSTAGSATITNRFGGELAFYGFSTAGDAIIITQNGGSVSFNDASTGGNAQFITNGSGVVDFSGTIGPNLDSRITAGSIAGSGTYIIGGIELVVGSNNLSTIVSGEITDGCGCAGPGSLTKVGSGQLTLSGTNSYRGATTVVSGILNVTGSIASSLGTTVQGGGTLTGTGIVSDVLIEAGGIFAPGDGTPGSSMQADNLTFLPGGLYAVYLNSTTSSFASVLGTAALDGIVVANFVPGSSVLPKYKIMDVGSVIGDFAGVSAPGGLVGTTSFGPNAVFLNFVLNWAAKFNLNINQQNVANTLQNFFNANGTIPFAFAGLTPGGLTQVSGELATGTQQATFDAMNLFLGLITDPFIAGRDGGLTGNGGATPFAAEANAYAAYKPNTARDAFAKFPTKADVARNDLLDNRWSIWGSAFGGGRNTDGNAVVGSNAATARAFGFAAGVDYRISPQTIAGFALAGGGTNFSVLATGSGRSDMFQAGVFVRHNRGPAYVTAAAAFGWQDVSTDRTVTAVGFERLHAQFSANAISGRIEGGYRHATPWMGVTPYAAGQFITYFLPSYSEQVQAGPGNFALNYAAKDVTAARTELGVRLDKSLAMQSALLTLRGRFAWAHDFYSDRSITPAFQTLPGTSFVVFGAAQPRNSALTTAAAEMKWFSGWSTAAIFEGQFSDISRSYAGKGVVRYSW